MQYRVGATRTIAGKNGWAIAVFMEVPVPGAIECVLDCVHPGNLGPLPPSPDLLLSKAIQLGLTDKWSDLFTEVAVWRAHQTPEQHAEMIKRLRANYYSV